MDVTDTNDHPNDEAISGPRLHRSGLSEVLWLGAVRKSGAIDAMEPQNRVHPYHDQSRFEGLTHHVVLVKECDVEVIVEPSSIQRVGRTTLDAAVTASGG